MNWNKRLLNTPIIGDITKKIVSMKVSHDAYNIAEHFTQFLEPQVAVSEALEEEAFKIRLNVYCEELAFEEIKEGGQEKDEFDDQSIFSLIKHKPTHTYTSCVSVFTIQKVGQLLPIE
jgi:N-acyl amino acid synthase of PEP-CTERM/exosortase system